MKKRDVIRAVLDGKTPPYVPWSMGFTFEAYEKLQQHYGVADLSEILDDHVLHVGNQVDYFQAVGNEKYQDVFGVVWDRSVDKDIGVVCGQVLPEPTLKGYQFPNPLDTRFFADIPQQMERFPDRYCVFDIGFSLYERAWTMRGLETFMMDFIDHPGFVDELLNTIADFNIAQIRNAVKYPIDGVWFGDDWGQQHGLQMGGRLWKRHIYPVLKRMYGEVHAAGLKVFIHSCGDVDELFDDLIDIGLNCFNPFQPEVMDVSSLLEQYRGRLSFLGGLSTQKTLPYGSVDDVQREVNRLLDLGRKGSYIIAPAHAVEGDVPLENMIALIELVQSQDI